MSNSPIERRRLAACAGALACACSGIAAAADVAPRVRAEITAAGSADVLLVLADQSVPTLAPLRPDADYRARRHALVSALRGRADADQADARAWLDAHGIAHRDFWIANLIQARIPASALAGLAARTDIARIEPNPLIANALPHPAPETMAPTASGISWGVSEIHAPQVWALGDTGQGVVIGGEDTGYQWDHPALKAHYRGWNGVSANHSYNWHDAIHDSPYSAPCINDSPTPCDGMGHGTHTMGTMTGDDGAGDQIGVAPGAKWIGCRNMDNGGNGTPARYIECMQWMLAPTNRNGRKPNPDLAPDVVSNSWYCPVSEGCTTGDEIESAVNNLVAAGILYLAAAGNSGSACDTISGPPATYDVSFVVGATNGSDALAGFSSRGPVSSDTKIRPDVVAPGADIYSSIPTNGYTTMQGTSMATPHVAGAAALLMSAFPALKGKPAEVASILRETAIRAGVTDPVTQSCGGIASTVWPNFALGYGRVDTLAAFNEVIFIDDFDR